MMAKHLPPEGSNESVNALVNIMGERYKGCFIEYGITGCKWGGKNFTTIEEAKEEIDSITFRNIQPPPDYHKTHMSVIVGNTEIPEKHKEKYLTGKSAFDSFKNKTE